MTAKEIISIGKFDNDGFFFNVINHFSITKCTLNLYKNMAVLSLAKLYSQFDGRSWPGRPEVPDETT